MEPTVVSDAVESRLAGLGLCLPEPPTSGGNYLPFRRSGRLLFLAGAISVDAAGQVVTGKVGVDRTVEEGYEAARRCALSQLAVVRAALGSLTRLEKVLTLNGYVNAAPDFTGSPQVINGASDLLVALFGDAGRHARAAVGVAALPQGALVEVQMTVQIADHAPTPVGG